MSIQPHRLDPAFERIEQSILPGVSSTLEMLLDAASTNRQGADAEAYAAQLRKVAAQLQVLTAQVESSLPAPWGVQGCVSAA